MNFNFQIVFGLFFARNAYFFGKRFLYYGSSVWNFHLYQLFISQYPAPSRSSAAQNFHAMHPISCGTLLECVKKSVDNLAGTTTPSPESIAEASSPRYLAFALFAFFLIHLLLDIWFLTIFTKLYFVLRELERRSLILNQHCVHVSRSANEDDRYFHRFSSHEEAYPIARTPTRMKMLKDVEMGRGLHHPGTSRVALSPLPSAPPPYTLEEPD